MPKGVKKCKSLFSLSHPGKRLHSGLSKDSEIVDDRGLDHQDLFELRRVLSQKALDRGIENCF